MTTKDQISGGVVHPLPNDLKATLSSSPEALATWEDITPLARNEWICWIESAKSRKPEVSGSTGAEKAWRMESADPVAGLGALIANGVEVSQIC